MAKINSAIVIFHNISSEDFTHHYDGIPWTILAGEKTPLQFPIAKTLAKHLAMRIIRKELIEKKKMGLGNKEKEISNIYTDASITALMEKIMIQSIDRPVPAEESKEAKAKREHEALKNEFGDQISGTSPTMTKKALATELKKREIKFDARKSVEELYPLIVEDDKKKKETEETEETEENNN